MPACTCNNNEDVVNLFKATYSGLYNNVSISVHIVDSLYSKINKLILYSHELRQPHITKCDVCTAIKWLMVPLI